MDGGVDRGAQSVAGGGPSTLCVWEVPLATHDRADIPDGVGEGIHDDDEGRGDDDDDDDDDNDNDSDDDDDDDDDGDGDGSTTHPFLMAICL